LKGRTFKIARPVGKGDYRVNCMSEEHERKNTGEKNLQEGEVYRG